MFTELAPINITVKRSRLDLFKLSNLQPKEPDFGSDSYRVLFDVPCLFIDPKTQWVWQRLELSCPPGISLSEAFKQALANENKQSPLPNGDPGEIKAYLCMSVEPYFGYLKVFLGDEDVRVVVQADLNLVI